MGERKFLRIGTILKPHGIRGELSVATSADSPQLFARGRSLRLVHPDGRVSTRDIQRSRYHHERLLLTLRGVEDRDAAEELRGCELSIPAEELPPLAEKEVYLHELQGLAIRLPDGSELGRLRDVETPAGQEIWVIETPQGQDVLFPAREDNVTLELEQGHAVIDPPPGLLEIYLGDGE